MATSRYTNMKVHISANQKDKIKKAVEDNTPVSIRFTHEYLAGNDVLAFTKSQSDKIAEEFENNKGITIKMS
jgi:ribosomal protein S15P/S13E